MKLFNFAKEESGAVTVDWVVLTAAVVALAGLAYSQVSGGVTAASTTINNSLSGVTSSL